MTDTPRLWDRRAAESDPAFEACAAYLDTGSLRDAYRQRSGNDPATKRQRRPIVAIASRPAGTLPFANSDSAFENT